MTSKLFVVALALLGTVEALRERRKSKSSCGFKAASPNVNTSIVNGHDASECEWNWQVGLRSFQGQGTPWCGGMLISETWILTAAHCVEHLTRDVWVVAGEHKPRTQSGNEQVRKAKTFLIHPNYNTSNMDFDVAIVELESAMEMNNCVGTVCLPTWDLQGGEECWITGWGTLKSGGRQPGTLQQAPVNIISNEKCHTEYDYLKSDITESMICAQGIREDGAIMDACQGDSGGPLVCKREGSSAWEIHGATSWGYGCAGKVYPGIWARINHKDVRKFIDPYLNVN